MSISEERDKGIELRMRHLDYSGCGARTDVGRRFPCLGVGMRSTTQTTTTP